MNGNNRSDISIGAWVKVIRKEDQRRGALTEGIVRDILTRSPSHPHGIKVRLEGGIVGWVKEILGNLRNVGNQGKWSLSLSLYLPIGLCPNLEIFKSSYLSN
jgi:uncharacterized repeat protein (TIGR03833 family)